MNEAFDTPVRHGGEALRRGYTTGSYVTAAVKAVVLTILHQHLIRQVSIVTPSRMTLCLNAESPHIEEQQAIATIRRDGGSDVDTTHGMLIFTRMTLDDSGVITSQGGEEVGTVTRKGIGLPVGSSVINRAPHQTTEPAVREAIGPNCGAQIEIFAPEGEERMQKIYNSRLGILGGISIIGTTGIVMPMSGESWRRSLLPELETRRAVGLERVVLVSGNHGERSIRKQIGIDAQVVVTTSNFVDYMIEEVICLGFRQIMLMGYPGEFVKVVAGVFHTHSHIADARMEALMAHLALPSVPLKLLTLVSECDTIETTMGHIDVYGFQHIYDHLAQRIYMCALQILCFTKNPPTYSVIILSSDSQILGSNRPVAEIAEEMQY